eukprot:m.1366581 g.1366581  ORF g.1366581 m.1366581 type:complete len:180 (+) comp24952_c0_seq18:1276-1815(+)
MPTADPRAAVTHSTPTPNGSTCTMTEREFREFYSPAFKGSVEANVSGFMCSYSAITLTDNAAASNNTPACANSFLLQEVTRGEWNFKGFVISDAGATSFIADTAISPRRATGMKAFGRLATATQPTSRMLLSRCGQRYTPLYRRTHTLILAVGTDDVSCARRRWTRGSTLSWCAVGRTQ